MSIAKPARLSALTLAIMAAVTMQTATANMPTNPNAKPVTAAARSADTDQLIIRFRDNANATAVDKVLKRMRSEQRETFAYTKTTANKADNKPTRIEVSAPFMVFSKTSCPHLSAPKGKVVFNTCF